MGNGTKIGLVVLLILGVILAAKFLDSDGTRGRSKEDQTRESAREAKRYRQPGMGSPSAGSQTTGRLDSAQRGTLGDGAASLAGGASTNSPYVDGRDTTFSRPRLQDPVGADSNLAGAGHPGAAGAGGALDLPSSAAREAGASPAASSGVPIASNFDARTPHAAQGSSASTDSAATSALGPLPSGTGMKPAVDSTAAPGSASLEPRGDAASYPKKHKIEPGDSLWKIAKQYYGNGALFEEIRKANPTLGEGNELRVGNTITIPAPPEASAAVAAPALREASMSAGKTAEKPAEMAGYRLYTIAEGDSLYAIAERLLSDGARWTEIRAANPGLDPDRLSIGKQIHVPAR
ncbi:MAG: LysM peptidoglycan-binding domain-containing protein [Planctomycetes bacterium]|nr:LysM peptidoglycan-binding domain-containing protein [Planctomycetota bacterium]